MPRLLPAGAVAAALLLAPAAPLAAQQVDVVRGRVVGPDRRPVENAQVTVTTTSGNVARSARTDRNGRFTVTVPGGDGDYLVAYQALGFAPRRMQLRRVADEDFLVADATLQRAAAVLDSVRVVAPRNRVARADAQGDVGGTERRLDPGVLPPEQLGDLAAMAAATPGVTPVPGADGDPAGFSVLGLSPDQNQTTMNGMPFAGSTLPRDAAVLPSLVTSPYDVSVGGFSGARFNVRPRPGTNFVQRGASLVGSAPGLQWTDRAAAALGQQSTNGSLAGSVSGPILPDQAFYALSYQLGRQANALRTLLDTDAVGLAAAGLAADSVARLTTILAAQGVPLRTAAIPGDRLADQGSILGTVDLAPQASNSGQSVSLAVTGAWNRQRPAALAPSETPAHAGERTSWNAGGQLRHSSYVRNVLLSETTLNLTRSESAGTPYLALPSAQVLVNSTFADGSTGVQRVSFGGNPWIGTSQAASSAGVMHQLSWFSGDNRHRLKLATELRRDGFAQDMTVNALGSYGYNSLADLEAGRAQAFTRQLAPRVRRGSQLVGALSLGDAWQRSRNLQLQYGVRLDAYRFGGAPAANPLVARTFGVPNDAVPDRVHASPRVGFAWSYGTAPQIAGFAGAMRGPRATVRGGVGVFQNVPAATLLGPAMDNTGLPGAVQQLACTGAAVPAAAWSGWTAGGAATVPSRCADGGTGTPFASSFASSAPNVTLLARDWRAARSTRATLGWSGAALGNRVLVDAGGAWSRNAHQGSVVDLNFAGVRRFALADEGGRPVYARPEAIVPATGAVAAREGRLADGFLRVGEQRSDLRSTSAQLSLGVRPAAFGTRLGWSATYTWQRVREQNRGFQSAAGDPWAVEWTRAALDVRHQLVYSLSYNLADAVRVSWFGNVRSGIPFTPQVNADVNGDGWANDRAFVADPARARAAGDPALAAGLEGLLAGGAPQARRCLRAQLGRVAARHACEGPWTQNANLALTLNPLKVRLPQRATLSLTVANPLGAVDRLLHGEQRLRGWGQMPVPDPQLLYVRGFDPARQRWRYEVNQRFGATAPRATAFRTPVTLTLMLRMDLGPTRERQLLVQQLDRGRRRDGERAPEVLLRAMYGNGGVPNPLAELLRQADTLRLDGRQADSLATLNRWYVVRLDSIWTPLTRAFAALPADYDRDAAAARYLDARRATLDLLARLAPAARGLLSAEQRRRLPPLLASHLDGRYLAAIRSGTAGGWSQPTFAGGMGGGFGGAMAPGGFGGGERIIIR